MALAQTFAAPYLFKKNNTVVIQHKGGAVWKSFLRVKPNDEGNACPNGGKGALAQWTMELQADGAEVKLKSNKSGKYLRIHNNAIDVQGIGGKFTEFKVHMIGAAGGGTAVKLESKHYGGQYIAVQKDNNIRIGKGGPWTELRVFRDAPILQPQPFSKPYLFGKKNVVVIEHKGGKFLRVKNGAEGTLDPDGGKGALAQWEAEPMNDGKEVKLKSTKSGNYLRIFNGTIDVSGKGGPWTVFKVHSLGQGKAKLESNKLGGKYIAVQGNNNVAIGGGGQWTEMKFYRKE